MGAITGALAVGTEMNGAQYKLVSVTASVAAASDTITLTLADHGIRQIDAIVGAVITGGLDAAFTNIQVSFSVSVLFAFSFQVIQFSGNSDNNSATVCFKTGC